MIGLIRQHPGAAAVAGVFVALGIVYSLVSPVFEVSDEYLHYPVIHTIAQTGRLPVQQPGIRTAWDQEGSQPPLYYLIGAAATFWIDTSDHAEINWRNPHRRLGLPDDPDNKNLIVHTDAEQFPWQGTVLAVHLLRFMGVALGAAAVVMGYSLIATIWPHQRWMAVLGAALMALNPMFIHIMASVNNDGLAVLLGTWTLLLAVRTARHGLTTRRAATLCIVTALSTLTKLSGLTIAPVAVLAVLVHAWRIKSRRTAWRTLAGLVLAWLVLAGWWYARNQVLYGELLGTRTMIAIAGAREAAPSLWDLRREWYGFWASYWALFGAVNILADAWVYVFLSAISWLCAGGLGIWAMKAARRRAWDELVPVGLLALQVVLTFAGVLRWTLLTYGSQGRLMFPAISAASALMATGLLGWVPSRLHPVIALGICAPLGLAGATIPFRAIAPVYAPPPVVASLPADAIPVGATYGGLDILALEVDDSIVHPGERLPVTLYIRASRPIEARLSLYLAALGQRYQQIGRIDTYPGGGALPTTSMQPGLIYADSYSIRLADGFAAPTVVRLAVGAAMWQEPDYLLLDGRNQNGETVRAIVVDLPGAAYPAQQAGCAAAPAAASIVASFGGFAQMRAEPVALSGQAGTAVPLTLYWDMIGSTQLDWIVVVRLVGEDGQVVAATEATPLNGDYPTSHWRQPCQFADSYFLTIPTDAAPGLYTIRVGMVRISDGVPVLAPATEGDGTPYPGSSVLIGTVTVEGR